MASRSMNRHTDESAICYGQSKNGLSERDDPQIDFRLNNLYNEGIDNRSKSKPMHRVPVDSEVFCIR